MGDQLYTYYAEMCNIFSYPKRLDLIDSGG